MEAFLLHIYGLNSVQCQKDCFYLQNLGHWHYWSWQCAGCMSNMNPVYGLALHEFSVAQVDRVSTRCLGGYRFESCQGLRFFLCPLLVTDNISFSHRKSLFNSYHWPLACGGGGTISQSHLLFLNLPQLKIFLTTLIRLILCKNGLQKHWHIILKWNLVNTVSHINGVIILTKVF